MPAAPADSALYAGLFGDAETSALFSDSAEIASMLLVEGSLARAQGEAGVIPQASADFINHFCRDAVLDPAALAAETAVNGVPVPGLLSALRKAMDAPDHAQYLHWGATSQDIMETGQMLRLKQFVHVCDARLKTLIATLAGLAGSYADLPMAARTYGQNATPSTFGALVASWGNPLMRHRERLRQLQPRLLRVSLGGAAGTLSVMGDKGPAVRAAMAMSLGLADPGHSWHAERDGIAEFANWMTGVCASLGKMGEDIMLLSHSGISEISVSGAGASSTMPQKENPVGASVLVALARQSVGLAPVIQGAALHREFRDGAAWFTEWLTLPQVCISTGKALELAGEVASRIAPDPIAMAAAINADGGLIHAEALTFALAKAMPRTEAQKMVGKLCAESRATEANLLSLAKKHWPEIITDIEVARICSNSTAGAAARSFLLAVQDQG